MTVRKQHSGAAGSGVGTQALDLDRRRQTPLDDAQGALVLRALIRPAFRYARLLQQASLPPLPLPPFSTKNRTVKCVVGIALYFRSVLVLAIFLS